MEVKIYREPENENLILNDEDRAKHEKLIDEMGLAKIGKVEKVPCIYQRLNKVQQTAIMLICPEKDKPEDYDASTIPLEVLEVLSYTKENNMFDGYYILHNYTNPDPILIGYRYKDKNKYSWQNHMHIIARWGDENKSLEELVQIGTEIMRKKLKEILVGAIAEAEMLNKNFESTLNTYMEGNTKIVNTSNPARDM